MLRTEYLRDGPRSSRYSPVKNGDRSRTGRRNNQSVQSVEPVDSLPSIVISPFRTFFRPNDGEAYFKRAAKRSRSIPLFTAHGNPTTLQRAGSRPHRKPEANVTRRQTLGSVQVPLRQQVCPRRYRRIVLETCRDSLPRGPRGTELSPRRSGAAGSGRASELDSVDRDARSIGPRGFRCSTKSQRRHSQTPSSRNSYGPRTPAKSLQVPRAPLSNRRRTPAASSEEIDSVTRSSSPDCAANVSTSPTG